MTDRILISAFAANPEMTSEAGIGWSFIRSWASVARSRNLDITVVMNEGPRLRLVEIRVPRAIRILEDPRFTRQDYLVWNVIARRQIRAMGKNHLLLAHRVTFATDMLPTPIVTADGAFKVWGPAGSSGGPGVFDVPPISCASIGEKRRHIAQRLTHSLAVKSLRAPDGSRARPERGCVAHLPGSGSPNTGGFAVARRRRGLTPRLFTRAPKDHDVD
jgi:hypothetical protein